MAPDNNQYLLGEMNAKLDFLIQQNKEYRESFKQLEERVKVLEALKWKIHGAALALGSGAGFSAAVIAKLMGS